MLALTAMDPGIQAFFFIVAVALFLVASVPLPPLRVNLIALGLAFATFVFFWQALAKA